MRQMPSNNWEDFGIQVRTSSGEDLVIINNVAAERLFSGLMNPDKPTEFIEMIPDNQYLDYTDMLAQNCSPDILISGQIPVPSLEILFKDSIAIYKMHCIFDPPMEIMKLQKAILDGELLLNSDNLPIIGSFHIHREPIRGNTRFHAYIPIIMDFYWDEEKFHTGINTTINIRGRGIESLLEMLSSTILADKYGLSKLPEDVLRAGYADLVDELYYTIRLVNNAYRLWYATQISLLNPLNKEYTRTTMEVVQESDKVKGGKKQKKLPKKKYIKRIYLDFNKMNELGICNEKTKHKYSKPIWWVMGHYRTYAKTGKRVFIQGYWKGALRDLKSAEPRERELVMED